MFLMFLIDDRHRNGETRYIVHEVIDTISTRCHSCIKRRVWTIETAECVHVCLKHTTGRGKHKGEEGGQNGEEARDQITSHKPEESNRHTGRETHGAA